MVTMELGFDFGVQKIFIRTRISKERAVIALEYSLGPKPKSVFKVIRLINVNSPPINFIVNEPSDDVPPKKPVL